MKLAGMGEDALVAALLRGLFSGEGRQTETEPQSTKKKTMNNQYK